MDPDGPTVPTCGDYSISEQECPVANQSSGYECDPTEKPLLRSSMLNIYVSSRSIGTKQENKQTSPASAEEEKMPFSRFMRLKANTRVHHTFPNLLTLNSRDLSGYRGYSLKISPIQRCFRLPFPAGFAVIFGIFFNCCFPGCSSWFRSVVSSILGPCSLRVFA